MVEVSSASGFTVDCRRTEDAVGNPINFEAADAAIGTDVGTDVVGVLTDELRFILESVVDHTVGVDVRNDVVGFLVLVEVLEILGVIAVFLCV